LFGGALELAEQIELWLFAWIAPFRVDQPMGEVKHEAKAQLSINASKVIAYRVLG
jgi:hypothetical protein